VGGDFAEGAGIVFDTTAFRILRVKHPRIRALSSVIFDVLVGLKKVPGAIPAAASAMEVGCCFQETLQPHQWRFVNPALVEVGFRVHIALLIVERMSIFDAL
jgi:hypothetical protein